MEIPAKPVHRVHMVDCKRQTVDERARLSEAASEVLAWMFVAACLGFGLGCYLGWLRA